MSVTLPELNQVSCEPPRASVIFRVFLSLGMQSFGGGVATFALIRNAIVEKRRWVSEEEFTHLWAMVQLAPGINLLALVILIGHQIRGFRGALAALAGLMIPSCIITTAIAAVYSNVSRYSVIKAALKGAIPAIVAVGLLTCLEMAIPILRPGKSTDGRVRWRSSVVALLFIAASAAAAAVGKLSIAAILVAFGLLGAAESLVVSRLLAAREVQPK